jgi:hypothetical protein
MLKKQEERKYKNIGGRFLRTILYDFVSPELAFGKTHQKVLISKSIKNRLHVQLD